MRTFAPAAAAVSASVVALALTLPLGGAANAAGVSKHDQNAKTITVTRTDKAGDLTAQMGTVTDLSTSSGNLVGSSPFKKGHGTTVTPNASEKTIDIKKVSYKLVRTGKKPSLTITYTFAGKLAASTATSTVNGVPTYTESGDMVGTALPKGYSVVSTNDKNIGGSTGLIKPNGAKVSCSGFSSTMKKNSRTVKQVVPLSCLAKVHLKSGSLRSAAYHLLVSVTSINQTTPVVVAVWDTTTKTRVLPFTKK